MKHSESVAIGLRARRAINLKTSEPLTRKEKLDSVSDMFATRIDESFATIKRVEWGPQWFLQFRSTRGTVLAPVVEHLNRLGIPTEPTLAGVMRSLEIDRHELHQVACYCHTHSRLYGSALVTAIGLIQK